MAGKQDEEADGMGNWGVSKSQGETDISNETGGSKAVVPLPLDISKEDQVCQ